MTGFAAARYFALRYFAPRYWLKGGTSVPSDGIGPSVGKVTGVAVSLPSVDSIAISGGE